MDANKVSINDRILNWKSVPQFHLSILLLNWMSVPNGVCPALPTIH